MTRCASGSIQVVTNVARLRMGMPSRTSSSPSSRMASTARIPCLGSRWSGAGSSRKRLPYSRARASSSLITDPWVGATGAAGCSADVMEQASLEPRGRRTSPCASSPPSRVLHIPPSG